MAAKKKNDLVEDLLKDSPEDPVPEAPEPEKEAPEKEKRVPVHLFKDSHKYKDDVFVAVNGVGMQIKRGVKVEIPESFAEVLEHSMQQDAQTADLINQYESDFAANADKLQG